MQHFTKRLKAIISYCYNNRGIALSPTTSMLLQMIFLRGLSNGMEKFLRENQFNFRQNRSCIGQVYSLRSTTIIHQCIEYNIHLYHTSLLDFKATIDSADRQFIWRAALWPLLQVHQNEADFLFSHNQCWQWRSNGLV